MIDLRRRCVGALALAATAAVGCSLGRDAAPERIIVVTWDTTRADRLGCYGYDAPTSPNLDRFADEAVLFERAVSPVPTTLPSHSSMFTGLYPQDHGVRYNIVFSLSGEARTLPELLQEAGYRTAGFPAALVLSSKYGMAQGFDHWSEPSVGADVTGLHAMAAGGTRSAGEGVDEALAWLREQKDTPTFVWLHFYDPHGPFTPPFPYSSKFRERPYDGELAYTDAQFGRLLDELRQDPQWDRTVVVMAGDHGEGLQDHGESWHTYLLYETTQHAPLIVRAPGYRPARVAEPVSLADITPTVLELAGLDPLDDIRGVSLAGALGGSAPPARFIYFETHAGTLNYGWQEISGVRFGNWKLIDSSAPELYDLDADPGETTSLAAADPERLNRFRGELAQIAQPIREATTDQLDQDLSPEDIRAFAALGYVAGGTGGDVAADARTPQSQIDLETEINGAKTAVRLGNWPYVEDLCRYIHGRDPKNKWALTNLTMSLLEQGRAADADLFSAELIEFYPKNPNSYMTRGRALSEMGRADEAYALLLLGREHIPDSEQMGYLTIVAGFDAGEPVCDGDLEAVMGEFPKSGRLRMLNARCALRDEGGVQAALDELAIAFELGFKGLESLRLLDEFAPLVADERFQDLLDRIERSKTAQVQTFPAAPTTTE